MGRQGDAGTFKHVDHAEQAYWVIPGDEVIEEADHQLNGQGRTPVTHCILVAAAGMDVVEYPLFMAVFVFDVFADRFAQPLQARREACTTGHHQRYGVAYVVVSLSQKGPIAFQADPSLKGITNDRKVEQFGPFFLRGQLQRVKKLMIQIPRCVGEQSVVSGKARQWRHGGVCRWRSAGHWRA